MSYLAVSLAGWTEFAALSTLLLAVITALALGVTIWLARSERDRDDARRQQDRQHDAELRRQDREREDQLRRDAEETWERRRRAEQRQREDDDAQQVTVEFAPGGPLSRPGEAVISADGVTHRVLVRASTAYPLKWVDARIAHLAGSSLGILPTGWIFAAPAVENGQVIYTCNVETSRRRS